MRGKFTKDYWIVKWSGLFDPYYYLKRYPDVRQADVDPLEHFVLHGWKEGRNPNDWFNTREYLEKNPDVAQAGINPFMHWIRWGRFENNANFLRVLQHFLKFLLNRKSLYKQLITKQNIKKSMKYIKKYGFKAFLVKVNQKLSIFGNYSTNNNSVIDDYYFWIITNEPSLEELTYQKLNKFVIEPKISIVTAVYNTKREHLIEIIESVLNQSYLNWELCIVDGGSEKNYIKEILDYYSKKDDRIKVKYLPQNKGIASNFNEALRLASGEYITFLDHDDLLAPFALYEIVKVINSHPDVDFIYSDEDQITEDSIKRINPIFKPDWSPDTLRSYNYITHLMVIKKALLDEVGWFREGYDGAQDYDLALRCTEKAKRIVHIPKILYHWRAHSQSTAFSWEAKLYAHEAGKKALEDHLKRLGIDGFVEDLDIFCYNVRYKLNFKPFVSIIIPTKDKVELLQKCIESILNKSTYENYEIIILNNKSKEDITYRYFKEISSNTRIKIVDADYDFNWSKLCNHGISEAKGDVFIFLNNDTVVITPDWIERLSEKALQDWVGAVGCLLLYEDNTIQHAGVIVGLMRWAEHYYKKSFLINSYSPFVSPLVCRNVLAVTGACMAVSRKTIEKIGYFDERFTVGGGDVEFCIRAYENGLYNVYDPSVKLYHLESKTRGTYVHENDFKESERVYRKYWIKGDPFYNTNLSLSSFIPTIKIEDKPISFIQSSSIPELTPINVTSSKYNFRRINLLVPSVYVSDVFGGIHTALFFLKEFERYLRDTDVRFRIIVTDSSYSPKSNIIEEVSNYRLVSLNEDSDAKYQLCFAGDRMGKQLHITPNDVFIATAWWTAYLAKQIVKMQYMLFQKYKPLIYLIQDYEPGFYNWSSRYVLAESTYKNDIPIIAVVNSKELSDFLEKKGYMFYRKFFFKPKLNIHLKKYIDRVNHSARKNRILIYGRPSVARNAFELIIDALKLFCYEEISKHFDFISLGEKHEDIMLPNGQVLVSKGKVSLEEYAKYLLESKIGISLMISPHPSYPPIEMACFGLHVITNKFECKDLSLDYPNIISIEENSLTPQEICKYLIELAKKNVNNDVIQVDFSIFKEYLDNTDMFNFLDKIIEEVYNYENILLS